MQLIKGTELKRGDYRIIDVLGQGGFGITYLAQQIGLGRKVAIKEFFMKDLCNRGDDGSQVSAGSTGSKDLVERFKQKFLKEARLIASFNNAHIIRIHDVFEENGTAYYVMEYLEGESLKEVVDNNGALPETVAVKYILQVADALSAVHANNLLHLDVKPANIMLDENCNAVLIDFGVSKHYDEKGAQTSSAGVGLSEGYAPLEQYEAGSLKDFTPATDIYALGATLFMLLTGARPPKASVVNDDGLPPMPTAISAPVRKAVEKAMQPRRKDRPQNIDEFVKLLKLPNPKPNNNKWQWIAILLLIIICGALGGFMLFGGGGNDEFADTSVKRTEQTTVKTDTANKENDKLVKKENEEDKVNTAFATAAINGHEYVDLGLPSGLKWATCNVGASKPEEYGNYYAWGETSTKSNYSSDNSVTDGKNFSDIGGDPQYDVARKQWGGSWRLPTEAEFEELLNENNCTWTWTTQNGIKGCKVTSKKNGNSIFLPAAGWRDYTWLDFQGTNGSYWGSTPHEGNSNNAYYLYFSSGGHDTGCYSRYSGQSVRPVSGGIENKTEKTSNAKPASNKLSIRTFKANGVEFTMVAVDGGTFSMGSNDGGNDEKPIHQVTLDSYFIGETEVTQALWQAVMGTTIHDQAKKGTINRYLHGTGDNNPMYYINYNDCIDFVNKLNTLLKDQLPQGRKFRLPTEAEWEYAARGGNKSKGCKYSGSNSISTVAWYDGNSGGKTHPVKQKACNELGLYDMSGNVYEWCSDWYDDYSSSPQNNPKGPGGGNFCVLRGGSCYDNEQGCRSAFRNFDDPGRSYGIYAIYGLRLAF